MSNPPPVIQIYRQSLEALLEKSISQKFTGEKWNDEPEEVRIFFSAIYKTFKKAMQEKKIDQSNIKSLWQQKEDSQTSEQMEEEDTNDHSLNFEEISSILQFDHSDAQQFSIQSLFPESSSLQQIDSFFLQKNSNSDLQNIFEKLKKLSINEKLDESFAQLSKLKN